MTDPATEALCFCGKDLTFDKCCGRLLTGKEFAKTPEELMRSRYSAFCLKNLDYIVSTTHPDHIINFDINANRQWMNQVQFTRLEVVKTGFSGNIGRVEFKAYFTLAGKNQMHHEHSEFQKVNEHWYYCIH